MFFDQQINWEQKRSALIKRFQELENFHTNENNVFEKSFVIESITQLDLSNDDDQQILLFLESIVLFVDLIGIRDKEIKGKIFYYSNLLSYPEDKFQDYLSSMKDGLVEYKIDEVIVGLQNARNKQYIMLAFASIAMIACAIALAIVSHLPMSMMISLMGVAFMMMTLNVYQIVKTHHDEKTLISIHESMTAGTRSTSLSD